MSDRPTILLEHHLKELKLPTFLREYGKIAAQCASEGVDHPDYLLRLSELELIDRHHRLVARRIKAARFPAVKSLDTFDFGAIPSVNRQLVTRLARCEYIESRENIIAIGNSGTGKTHVALGLGLAACQKGLTVGFTTASALVNELMEARDEMRLLNMQKRLARLKLLIIDELGFVPGRFVIECLCGVAVSSLSGGIGIAHTLVIHSTRIICYVFRNFPFACLNGESHAAFGPGCGGEEICTRLIMRET